MDIRRKLGARVQQLRQHHGLSQEELAGRADIHRTYVSGVERGVRNPTVTVLEKIANGLGVTLPELVTFE
jgi:transcriptional regulator with XRE-family HTH domain